MIRESSCSSLKTQKYFVQWLVKSQAETSLKEVYDFFFFPKERINVLICCKLELDFSLKSRYLKTFRFNCSHRS